ncbi:MAG: hypothetical protein EOP09_19070, partial [Proteobacteria bacterium]
MSGPNRRLVIVIDNLDRVPEEEALQIWATIRSFFTGATSEKAVNSSTDPLVLLPIDRGAIKRMFARSHGPENAKDLAESFVHKTFEVTFEVTQPVMSDWREFLAKQMKEAFGSSIGETWIFWTRKFFERKQQERKSSPTPRQINRLVNRLLASYMQWEGQKVVFPVQAYYAVFQEDIEETFSEFIVSNQADLAKISPRWQEQISALYYGVEVEKAIQTLLDAPMRLALLSGSTEAVNEFINVPGFDDTLELMSSDLSSVETGEVSGIPIIKNLIAVVELANRPNGEATGPIWFNAATYYCALENVSLVHLGAADAVRGLAAHVPQNLADEFVDITVDAVARGLQADDATQL